MTTASIYKSKPDHWTKPRPFHDADTRYIKHGAVRPMHKPNLLERIVGSY